MKNKIVMITGGTGYLGSNLINRLLSENYSIILLKRSTSDISRIKNIIDKIIFYDIDKENLETIFQKNDIDVIIHCATNYGLKEKNPINILEANFLLPLQLLQLSEKFNKVQTFINTDTVLNKNINNYTLSKKQFKEWMKKSNWEKRVGINLELEHFFGPLDNKSRFITFLIKKMLANVENINLTKGEQKRNFVFIDDVIDAFLKIINHATSLRLGFHEFYVGTEENISIKDLAKLIKKLIKNCKTKLCFGAVPYRKNELMETKNDSQKLRKLGWNPKTNLEQGLKITIEKENK